MSDDESPETPPAEEAPRRKRKPRPTVSSQTAPAKAPVRTAVVASPAASQWTTGHVAAALALGLALGGMGGYLFAGKSGPSAVAEGSNKPVASGPAANKQGPPTAGAYVPLAAWTPREGPEQAKVTIVEFSDFQ